MPAVDYRCSGRQRRTVCVPRAGPGGPSLYDETVQRVLSAEASAELDASSSTPVDILMDRAGLAVALTAVDMGAAYGRRVVVLAGPGNNGGDGYVAAVYLARRGVAVTVVADAEPRSAPAIAAARRAVETGARMVGTTDEPPSADLLIDALFGGGFHGDLHPRYENWIRFDGPILAVDVPSGLNASTGDAGVRCFTADRTITFHALKTGHLVGEGPRHCGAVEVADIGLEGGDADFWIVEEADAPRPVRKRTSHKWSVGSVMVVGGSPGMTGAAWLAARSALRSGAGAVAIATNEASAGIYGLLAPELLTPEVGGGENWSPDDAVQLVEAAERYDVLVVGPGLGEGHGDFVRTVLERRQGAMLVDADALNALSDIGALELRTAPTIITPHGGEFSRLTGVTPEPSAAQRLADATGAVVLLKGPVTFIAARGVPLTASVSGGPELATIGTGDVLAGVTAALWARGLDPVSAARSGAFWHGRSAHALGEAGSITADRLAEEVARWVT